jgi:hypothetical protein
MMIFCAADPADFENFAVFGKRPSERRRQVRVTGKIDDVEAASLGLPRLGEEIYNALIGRHAELIFPSILHPHRTNLFDTIVIQDESL